LRNPHVKFIIKYCTLYNYFTYSTYNVPKKENAKQIEKIDTAYIYIYIYIYIYSLRPLI